MEEPSIQTANNDEIDEDQIRPDPLAPIDDAISIANEDSMQFSIGNKTEKLSLSFQERRFTKLEVVQARQIEWLLRWHHIFVAIGVLFSIVVLILMNTVYLNIWITPKDQGWRYDIRLFNAPKALRWFNQAIIIPMFLYALCLCITFSVRIFSLPSVARTKEQLWVVLLLISTVFYFNPFTAIVKIHDGLIFETEFSRHWGISEWCKKLKIVSSVLKVSSFTASTLFYVWASIHSYGILDSKIGIMFYLPKVLILAIYVASKVIVTFALNIYPTELMFANLVGMISLYASADEWYLPGILYASLSFCFDLALAGYIYYEFRRTKNVLKNADYLQYRTKQIGFRFFIYHNLTFYGVFFTLYIVILGGLPNGLNVFAYRLRGFRISYFELHDMVFGLQLLLLAYVTVEAYVNLPAEGIGFEGWFVPHLSKRDTSLNSDLEPITYRKREPPSLHGVVSDLSVNCFVMQTHVTLFNFAWLVYYWDTPKAENFKLTQDVFEFNIAEYIKDTPTDTHVLVVDGADRIIIAYKGTTSTKNLKTDINMFHVQAKHLLPTKLEDDDDHSVSSDIVHQALESNPWKRSKIHKGFACAYAAVAQRVLAVIKKLQSERRRPVFLTGHSLGGALATICSVDLFFKLGLSRKEVFVSTFGAPRVGNRHFWKVYNEYVPMHWRVVVGPDVVAKLPKMGYNHVGKKVLLTVDGDLFIDPNSLELNMWSGDAASLLYHRKASYLLAMRAWCERHHGDEYLPEFWPFPVSEDDTRRFQHAMTRTSKGSLEEQTRPARMSRGTKSRIMRQGEMIDALEGPEVNSEIALKWGRLVRSVMKSSDEEEWV